MSHYTHRMPCLALLIATLFAQADPSRADLVPYILRLKNDPELHHVLVDPSKIRGLSFDALVDELWAGEQWLQIQSVRGEEIQPEDAAVRKRRIEKGWKEHGGTQVTTRNGEMIWVLAEDKKWADKSQALLQAAGASKEIAAEPVEAPVEQRSKGPGFLRLWGPHMAIIAAGLGLAVGVYFVLLKPRALWSALDSGNQGPRRR